MTMRIPDFPNITNPETLIGFPVGNDDLNGLPGREDSTDFDGPTD